MKIAFAGKGPGEYAVVDMTADVGFLRAHTGDDLAGHANLGQ